MCSYKEKKPENQEKGRPEGVQNLSKIDPGGVSKGSGRGSERPSGSQEVPDRFFIDFGHPPGLPGRLRGISLGGIFEIFEVFKATCIQRFIFYRFSKPPDLEKARFET